MTASSRFRPGFRRNATEDEDPSSAISMAALPSSEKRTTISGTDDIAPHIAEEEPEVDAPLKYLVPTVSAQRGVQQVEAVTLTWTKPYLILVFIL